MICEFFEEDSIDEVEINSGNNQRIILVAANFRKEVTSTVLWLIANGINIKCIKVSLYSHDIDIFIGFNKIIPTPDTEQYVIKMSSKRTEEIATKIAKDKGMEIRSSFWEQLIEYFSKHNGKRFKDLSPPKHHWLNAGSGISGCVFTLEYLMSKSEAYVGITLRSRDKEKNKRIFDELAKHEVEIHNKFGAELNWRRNNDAIQSKIQFKSHNFGDRGEEDWPEVNKWLFENMKKIEDIFGPYISKLK